MSIVVFERELKAYALNEIQNCRQNNDLAFSNSFFKTFFNLYCSLDFAIFSYFVYVYIAVK